MLSGTEFASFMDGVEDEMQKEGLGTEFRDLIIASLILMDDVILIADTAQMLQTMLNIMEKFGRDWHLKYNIVKTKVMVVGHRNKQEQWIFNNKVVEECTEYVYLGEVITSDLALTRHIKRMTQKAYSTYNILHTISKDNIIGQIQMEVLIQLYKTCIRTSILYNAEVWTPSGAELCKMEGIQIGILRKIMKAPASTPKLALNLELGIWPLRQQIYYMQLMYLWKLSRSQTITRNLLEGQQQLNATGTWTHHIRQVMTELDIDRQLMTNLSGITKTKWKKIITEAIEKLLQKEYSEEVSRRSKLTKIAYMVHQKKPPQYITKLPRDLAAALFRVRTRTTNVADNHGKTAPVCRYCEEGVESDSHIYNKCTKFTQLRNDPDNRYR